MLGLECSIIWAEPILQWEQFRLTSARKGNAPKPCETLRWIPSPVKSTSFQLGANVSLRDHRYLRNVHS